MQNPPSVQVFLWQQPLYNAPFCCISQISLYMKQLLAPTLHGSNLLQEWQTDLTFNMLVVRSFWQKCSCLRFVVAHSDQVIQIKHLTLAEIIMPLKSLIGHCHFPISSQLNPCPGILSKDLESTAQRVEISESRASRTLSGSLVWTRIANNTSRPTMASAYSRPLQVPWQESCPTFLLARHTLELSI